VWQGKDTKYPKLLEDMREGYHKLIRRAIPEENKADGIRCEMKWQCEIEIPSIWDCWRWE
jgi:hypothetical protein